MMILTMLGELQHSSSCGSDAARNGIGCGEFRDGAMRRIKIAAITELMVNSKAQRRATLNL